MVPETILGSSAVTAISTHIALHCLSCFDFFLLKFWYLYHKTILIILKTVKILFFYQLYVTLPLHPRTDVPQTTLLPPQTHSHMFLCFVLLLITAVNSRGYAKLHSHLWFLWTVLIYENNNWKHWYLYVKVRATYNYII